MGNLTSKLKELTEEIEEGNVKNIGILVCTKDGATSMITSDGFSSDEFLEAVTEASSTRQAMSDVLNNLPC